MRKCLQVAIASSVEDGERMLNVTTGSGERVRLAKEESVMPREVLYFCLKGERDVASSFG